MSEAILDQSKVSTAPGCWQNALTQDEINELLAMNDAKAWLSIAVNWAIIFTSMAMVAVWPNVLTVIAALFLVGARQLGLAVLMHEASHRSLFSNRTVNDFVGQWLCAYPIWSDTQTYRPYHLQHHAKTGSAEDPDLGLVKPFPITKASLRRKIWRDLSGQTGGKFVRASIARSRKRWSKPDGKIAVIGVVVTNALLLAAVTAAGYPALYLLWIGAYMTTNTLVTRIRAIAEHALTPDCDDLLNNTRTTLGRWWERLLIAPNRVNYHLEHHLLMTVPHYNLPRMHVLLRKRGVLDRACIEERGYLAILWNAASRPEPLTA